MSKRRSLVLFGLIFLLSLPLLSQRKKGSFRNWVTASDRKEKIALVLANEDYGGDNQLLHPINDAELIAQVLNNDGYDVLLGYNLNKGQLELLIIEFATKFQEYQQGLLFYAGHGFQIDGNNYLIPIDAAPKDAREVDFYCTDLNRIFRILDDPSKNKVIILDACRNHGFLDNSSNYESTKEEGFSGVRASKKSLLVYSTAPNTAVLDDNPFTEELAKGIAKGGCIYAILKDVSLAVERQDSTQVVWHEGSLVGDLCFGPEAPSQPSLMDAAKPRLDADGDGTPDDADLCPNSPGAKENRGCPVINAFKWQKVKKKQERKALVSSSVETMPEVFAAQMDAMVVDFYEGKNDEDNIFQSLTSVLDQLAAFRGSSRQDSALTTPNVFNPYGVHTQKSQDLRQDEAFFNEQARIYQKWLNEAGMSQYFRFRELNVKEKRLDLYLEFLSDDLDLIINQWNKMKELFESTSALTLEQQLFYKAASLVEVQQDLLSVQLYDTYDLSKTPLFSRAIYFDEGKVKIEESNPKSRIDKINLNPSFVSGGKAVSTADFRNQYNKALVFSCVSNFAKERFTKTICLDHPPEVRILEDQEVLRFQVFDLCKEVLKDENSIICSWLQTAGYNCSWAKRELLTFTITHENTDVGSRITVELDGKIGSGSYANVGRGGYVSPEAGWDTELENYANRLAIEISEMLVRCQK